MAIQDIARVVSDRVVGAEINPYQMMLQQLDLVREYTRIPDGIWEILRRP